VLHEESILSVLATFVLYAYNEERFIREAIESAFAQTYSPLEIVLSDDGSTDETFRIMQEMATGYKGPHTVILNRNEKNIGIGSQLNAAWRKSEGELIVLANGDDISYPNRVSRIVEAWLADGRKAAGISSAYELIDSQGRQLGRVVSTRSDFSDIARSTFERFGGPGAVSLCVSRECFKRFGPLLEDLIIEDGPINLRASLTGEWLFIDEPLVQYRVHGENISHAFHVSDFESWRARHRAKAVWQMTEGQKAFLQMLIDLYSPAVSGFNRKTIDCSRINAAEKLLEYQFRAGYYSGRWPLNISEWFKIVGRLFRIVIKTAIKKHLPFIEARNDRWHYKSALRAENSSYAARGKKTE
jgi:glycosyltransferase involved in cell wall biosynthesis